MTTVQATDWGPLSEPIHNDVPDGAPPWRDNAFLSFWDPDRKLFGTLHVSTSPNAEGRRSRLSVLAGGTTVEIVEPLEPGTFTSESIQFNAGAGFTVDAPRISGELTSAPHFALASYTGDAAPVAFGLDQEQPLMHYQRAATVTGRLVIDGLTVEINGHGFRDRTWGYRDESASISEYFGSMFIFPSFAVTSMRLLGGDGSDTALGFLLGDDTVRVKATSLTRDASGLFAGSRTEFADGRSIDVRSTERRAGFWCPMGWERSGPTLSAYDEFCALRSGDGDVGFGLVEQGIVKRLF
jgi:hypothetical protein